MLKQLWRKNASVEAKVMQEQLTETVRWTETIAMGHL